jgi:hypothetical protein
MFAWRFWGFQRGNEITIDDRVSTLLPGNSDAGAGKCNPSEQQSNADPRLGQCSEH